MKFYNLSYMTVIARVSKRYQVVIPKEVRKKLGIKEGDRVVFEIEGDEVRIRKVIDFLSLAGSLKGIKLSPRELRDKAGEEIAKDAV